MRFAKRVFIGAGVWGLAIVTPMFFLYDYIGRHYPPALTHPDFYYGFLTVTFCWQLAFLIIGSDPGRFRPMMIVAVLEKVTYVSALAWLTLRGDLRFEQSAVGIPDFVLGLLFVAAFANTTSSAPTEEFSRPLRR